VAIDGEFEWDDEKAQAGNEWLVISYTERGNKRRLISARRATRNERIEYQRQFE
jgi:uncharacterized DUF497 family protein